MSSDATVMPSWLVASMSVACSIAHSAVRADRDPASAFGSICERRAEMTAKDAPTKKALTRSSRTTSQRDADVLHQESTPSEDRGGSA